MFRVQAEGLQSLVALTLGQVHEVFIPMRLGVLSRAEVFLPFRLKGLARARLGLDVLDVGLGYRV